MTSYTTRPDLQDNLVECKRCERVFNRFVNTDCPYCQADDGDDTHDQ